MARLDDFLTSLQPIGRLLLDLAFFFAFWIFAFNPLFLVVEGRDRVEQTAPGMPFTPVAIWLAWARKLATWYASLADAVLGTHILVYCLLQ